MSRTAFGVDISLEWFDVAQPNERSRRFANTADGIEACLSWLGSFSTPLHLAMEATSSYHLPLATAVFRAGHTVYVCNPLSIHRYRQALLKRTKTDASDAQLIGRFASLHDLHPWKPTSDEQAQLQVLVDLRNSFLQTKRQLLNREHAATYAGTAWLLREHHRPILAVLSQQLQAVEGQLEELAAADTPIGADLRLLSTIKGVKTISAAAILATLPEDRSVSADDVVAYAGLAPQERSSGTSVREHASTRGFGNADLRRALYMPALVAKRSNPRFVVVAGRLATRSKPPKVITVAVMRKLLVVAWRMLQTRSPFDPQHGTRNVSAAA